jgi:uncharacterized DUF497 family protein
LDDLLGFDWDAHNAGHVALHDVAPAEVEQTTMYEHVIIPAAPRGGEKRWKLFGRTTARRYLVVVFSDSRPSVQTGYGIHDEQGGKEALWRTNRRVDQPGRQEPRGTPLRRDAGKHSVNLNWH